MSVELIWKHQQETFEKMLEQLAKTHRAGYTYATGCGKSFPALKLIEEKLKKNPNSKILCLAPYNTILKQMREYVEEYIGDPDSFPIEELLAKNIIFSTYANLNNRYMEYLKMDLIIADELHRVGAEEWGKAFENLLANNSEADIIGMTATPDRTDGKNMLDEYFEGENTVYEFSIADALSGDKTGEVVLNPSRYVRVLSELKPKLKKYKEEIDSYPEGEEKTKLLKKFEKVEETISVADNLKDTFTKNMTKKDGKYIIFCKDENDMKEAMEKAQEWFGDVNQDMWIDYLYSGTKSDKQNNDTLDEFRKPSPENEGKLKLLFCIDKVNEGVHIPDISGAISLRPTDSPVLYQQQIGRILTADKDAEETVFIDVANNWMRFKEHYDEFVDAVNRGQSRRWWKSRRKFNCL